MLPLYVTHSMAGRARLRHPALGEASARDQARRTLEREEAVQEVRPGAESLLLLLRPGADVAALCARLEEMLPDLRRPGVQVAAEVRARRRVERERRWQEARAARAQPGWTPFGLPRRRLEARALLAASGLCLASGLLGPGKLHLMAGLAAVLLGGRHVWARRKSL